MTVRSARNISNLGVTHNVLTRRKLVRTIILRPGEATEGCVQERKKGLSREQRINTGYNLYASLRDYKMTKLNYDLKDSTLKLPKPHWA